MTGASGGPATELTFLVAQYQLPEGMTGQDIASINSIDFRVRRASLSTPKLNYHIMSMPFSTGLIPKVQIPIPGTTVLVSTPTHNEVRFLTLDEISYYSDPGESAYIGILDTSSSGPADRPFGFTADVFQGETALQNRRDAVLQDTDGRITFYMRSRANFEVTTIADVRIP